LHLGASNGHFKVVKFLIEAGIFVDINPVDRFQETPYDNAL